MTHSTRPNFLLIMTDQLRPDQLRFGGNPLVHTPNLDQLAANGRLFTNAYCPTPSCGPSRNAMLTGRMPSTNGSWTNALSLDPHANTFVRVLRQHGYQTGLIGKSHLQDCINRTPGQGGMLDLSKVNLTKRPPKGEGRAVERPFPPNWDQYERHPLHADHYVQMPDDYYGFEHVELTLTHDDRALGHHRHWAIQRGGNPDAFGGRAHAVQTSPHWQQIWQSNTPLEFYSTTFVAEQSVAYLEQCVKEERPFFLQASFPDPHHPFALPDPYYSLVDPADVPLPPTFHDPHASSPAHFRRHLAQRGRDAIGPFTFSPSEAQFRHAAAVAFGSIMLLDQAVGQLLQTLERLHLADNTIILFCADHGDMFGDHGLMLKFATHYRGTINVPLLITGAGISPGQTDSLAGLLDLGQTILDLANCPPYIGMQGHSLRPVLDDPAATVRNALLIEEEYQADFLGVGTDLAMRTLITADSRLTLYEGSPEGELYDLQNDPHELNNLFNQPHAGPRRLALTEQLLRQMLAHRDLSRYPL